MGIFRICEGRRWRMERRLAEPCQQSAHSRKFTGDRHSRWVCGPWKFSRATSRRRRSEQGRLSDANSATAGQFRPARWVCVATANDQSLRGAWWRRHILRSSERTYSCAGWDNDRSLWSHTRFIPGRDVGKSLRLADDSPWALRYAGLASTMGGLYYWRRFQPVGTGSRGKFHGCECVSMEFEYSNRVPAKVGARVGLRRISRYTPQFFSSCCRRYIGRK